MKQELDTLPYTSTVAEAEEHYRVGAMQGHLRKLKIEREEEGRPTSIKEVEKHFDDLREADNEVYKTTLYSRFMLDACFSEMSDAQVRTGLEASDIVMRDLHSERSVINKLAREMRVANRKPTPEELDVVVEKIQELLPNMEERVGTLSNRSVEAKPRVQISEGMFQGGVAAKEPIKPELAKAILRLRTMIYERHPIDLVREVSNIQIEYESME